MDAVVEMYGWMIPGMALVAFPCAALASYICWYRCRRRKKATE